MSTAIFTNWIQNLLLYSFHGCLFAVMLEKVIVTVRWNVYELSLRQSWHHNSKAKEEKVFFPTGIWTMVPVTNSQCATNKICLPLIKIVCVSCSYLVKENCVVVPLIFFPPNENPFNPNSQNKWPHQSAFIKLTPHTTHLDGHTTSFYCLIMIICTVVY